jgi:hypothetical protein
MMSSFAPKIMVGGLATFFCADISAWSVKKPFEGSDDKGGVVARMHIMRRKTCHISCAHDDHFLKKKQVTLNLHIYKVPGAGGVLVVRRVCWAEI